MKHLVLLALAAALTLDPVSAEQAPPPNQIDGATNLKLGSVTLGERQSGNLTITPDTLQILGLGSSGDVSDMTTKVPSLPGGQSLSKWLQALGHYKNGIFRPGPTTKSVQLEAFAPPSEYANDAAPAFQAALNTDDVVEVRFCGNYLVLSTIVVPNGKSLRGCGQAQTAILANAPIDAVVRLSSASAFSDATVNSNNLANKGVEIIGDYVKVNDVLSQYAMYCFYNKQGNVSEMISTSHANCDYGFYSSDHWINSLIIGHIGRNGSNSLKNGGSSYGFYFTYSSQQPQAVRIISSQAFGDDYAIYFAKEVFSVNIRDSVLDGVRSAAITFNDVPCTTKDGPADIYISGTFMTGEIGHGIRIRPRSHNGAPCPTQGSSYNHVVIEGNHIAANGGISIEANSKSRVESVNIKNNSFGAGSDASTAIFLDSVNGAWVMGNTFNLDPNHNTNPTPDIAVAGTYAGTSLTSPVNPPVQVRFNRFEKSGTRVNKFNAVVSYNIGGP